MPKGRTKFTSAEAAEIRRLLTETRHAERSGQRRLRDGLRRIDFFITDFDRSFRGFGPEDFDQLTIQGVVEIDLSRD
ncbi:MAG: hypothetical protein Q8N51_07980 [Gammaproteobacteria bacterium]|nr:hypothetical protein [Gammaproteobacteria bacterium]